MMLRSRKHAVWAFFAVVGLVSVTQSGCKQSKTRTCAGNASMTFSGIEFAVGDGPAVDASGNCNITLDNCTIRAPEGIHAAGNATVTITGGTLAGSRNAIDASGNAKVIVSGTQVTGPVHTSGNAKVSGVAVTP